MGRRADSDGSDRRLCYMLRKRRKTAIKHGHATAGSQSKTYRAWCNMISRCFNPNYKGYKRYGGRGITVADEWRKFVRFLQDMGESPDGLTLERVDNDKGYSKANCKWATRVEQASNTCRNNPITWRGETKTLSAWARCRNIPETTLRHRIKTGIPLDEAMNRCPVKRYKLDPATAATIRKLRAEGMMICELSTRYGVCRAQIHNIVNGSSWK